jgi:hypothetical protein
MFEKDYFLKRGITVLALTPDGTGIKKCKAGQKVQLKHPAFSPVVYFKIYFLFFLN